MKPKAGEYFPYLENYLSMVKEEDLVKALEETGNETLEEMKKIPAEKWDFAYAAEKWTVKELFVHVMDAERVFAYRAMAFARGETQLLPAFDENLYAAESKPSGRQAQDLIEEFGALRKSSVCLFRSFSKETLQNFGTVPAGKVTVNALGFTICGHNLHHLKILRERYL